KQCGLAATGVYQPSLRSPWLAATAGTLIATTTCGWYHDCGAGGVAYRDVFGSGDTYSTGWVWNKSSSSLGMTLSHESGHQMGLHHDGNPDREYEHGHGDWGPIMGGPFGKSYVQWSKGEYPGANNKDEDDLAIIRDAIGEISDEAEDNPGSAMKLSLPVIEQRGVLRPEGLGKDIDVYSFDLPASATVNIRIGPPLGILGEKMGTSLSLKAQLISASGALITSLAPSSPPLSNILQETLPLASGHYDLVLEPLSYDPDWNTGFGEYGNGGYYSFTIEKQRGPDLVATSKTTARQLISAGQDIKLVSTVANLGDAEAAGTTLRYFIAESPNVTQNNPEAPETQQVASLAPAASVEVTQSLSVSQNLSNGHHWIASCVDPVSGESQTGNNCSKGVEIVVATGTCDNAELIIDQQVFSSYHFLKSPTAITLTNSQVIKNSELYIESPDVQIGQEGTSFSVESGSIFSITSAVPDCP
ncbi:CARDB domain-containing protein, partial [Thiolapillus sp.]